MNWDNVIKAEDAWRRLYALTESLLGDPSVPLDMYLKARKARDKAFKVFTKLRRLYFDNEQETT